MSEKNWSSEVSIGSMPGYKGLRLILSVCDPDSADHGEVPINFVIKGLDDGYDVGATIYSSEVRHLAEFFFKFDSTLESCVMDAKRKKIAEIEDQITALNQLRDQLLREINY